MLVQRDTQTSITNRYHNLSVFNKGSQADVPTGSEFDCVTDKVQGYLPQASAVSPHPGYIFCDFDLPGQSFVASQLLPDHGYSLQHFGHIQRLAHQFQLSYITAGQIQYITDQPIQVLGADVNSLQVFFEVVMRVRLARPFADIIFFQ